MTNTNEYYRKFWLINALGQRYDFTNQNSKIFLNSPRGLGFKRSYDAEKIGNVELVTSQQFDLLDITGELYFYGDSKIYEDYQNFIQFIKYKPLEFHYLTPNLLSDFYSDVLITSLDKSEINQSGALVVNVAFHRLSQWLTSNDYVVTLSNVLTDEGKYYPLVRPYKYAGTSLSNTEIVNRGTDDVGFVLQINGEVTDPIFRLSQNNEQYGICKVLGTYTYVIIDSVEKTEQIYLENNGSVIPNPYSYQDFSMADGQSYLTWCKFKVGTSIFNFSCSNISTFDGTITISFKNSYVSV